jgi:hypothetical protein
LTSAKANATSHHDFASAAGFQARMADTWRLLAGDPRWAGDCALFTLILFDCILILFATVVSSSSSSSSSLHFQLRLACGLHEYTVVATVTRTDAHTRVDAALEDADTLLATAVELHLARVGGWMGACLYGVFRIWRCAHGPIIEIVEYHVTLTV